MWSWSLTCLTCHYLDGALKVSYLNVGLGSLIAAREHVEATQHKVRVFIWNEAETAKAIAAAEAGEAAEQEAVVP